MTCRNFALPYMLSNPSRSVGSILSPVISVTSTGSPFSHPRLLVVADRRYRVRTGAVMLKTDAVILENVVRSIKPASLATVQLRSGCTAIHQP